MTLFPDDTASKSGLCVYEFIVKDNTYYVHYTVKDNTYYVHYTDHSPQTATERSVDDKPLSGNDSVLLWLILFYVYNIMISNVSNLNFQGMFQDRNKDSFYTSLFHLLIDIFFVICHFVEQRLFSSQYPNQFSS